MDELIGKLLTPGQLAQATAVAAAVRLIIIPLVKQVCPVIHGWATIVWALAGGVVLSELTSLAVGARSLQELAGAALAGLIAGALAVGLHQTGKVATAGGRENV